MLQALIAKIRLKEQQKNERNTTAAAAGVHPALSPPPKLRAAPLSDGVICVVRRCLAPLLPSADLVART